MLKNGSASSYGKALVNLQDNLSQYSDSYIDAPFYTNHDMARGAGYYSGDDSEKQTKIAQAMNLLMSGSAFLYYGEELGYFRVLIAEFYRLFYKLVNRVSIFLLCFERTDVLERR